MKKILCILAVAALFTACKTTKSAQQTESTTGISQAVQQQTQTKPEEKKSMTAKLDIDINAMGQSFSVDGRLSMRTNEVIRLTIVPFGLMEVGRLELTPDYILLINRMDNEYTKVTYQEFNAMSRRHIDFFILQEQIVSQTIVPGKTLDFAFTLPNNSSEIKMSCKVGKVTYDGNWESRTEIPTKYKQVTMAEILAKFGKL